MTTRIDLSISLEKSLYEQIEILSQRFKLSQSQFVERAVEQFVQSHELTAGDEVSQAQQDRPVARDVQVNQGDLYWARLDSSGDETAAIPHPYVIIQDNLLNHSRISTVVACALTSNAQRISETPGNVLLEAGEANLPKQSVVEVSKVTTMEKAQLGEYIGSLDARRVDEILAGMRFLQLSYLRR